MNLLRCFRLLPLLVIFASLSLFMRAENLLSVVGNSARAEQDVRETDEDPPDMPGKDQANDDDKGHEKTAMGEVSGEDVAEEKPETETGPSSPHGEKAEGTAIHDIPDDTEDYADIQDSVYRDLAKRREEIDERDKDLSRREALLKAAERELEQKMRELTALRQEIEGLLQDQSDEEKARIESLVRIYEGMKAKDAARIFDTLDMDVLVRVMGLMSERKSGPILAEMSPERARAVTLLLAQQKQLPQMMPQ